jgi:hypothetical protein
MIRSCANQKKQLNNTDAIVKHIIVSSISPKLKAHHIFQPTVKEMWDGLARMNEGPPEARVALLLEQFYNPSQYPE